MGHSSPYFLSVKNRELEGVWRLYPALQMSSVLASHPSHHDRPCENTGAVWTNTPSARGGIMHRAAQWITDTTQSTVQTYSDTHRNPRRHSHTRKSTTGEKLNDSPALAVQVLLVEWESFPEMKGRNPNLDKAQDSISVNLWKTRNQPPTCVMLAPRANLISHAGGSRQSPLHAT